MSLPPGRKRQMGRMEWTTEQTTELLNLISRNDGWRFCIFGKGYKTSFKYEATRQLCLAMFAKDKGWLQSMVKAGLIADDDGVWRATEAWMTSAKDTVQIRLRDKADERLRVVLCNAAIKEKFKVDPAKWKSWNDVPDAQRKLIKKTFPYYFIFRDLVDKKPLYASLPDWKTGAAPAHATSLQHKRKQRKRRRESITESNETVADLSDEASDSGSDEPDSTTRARRQLEIKVDQPTVVEEVDVKPRVGSRIRPVEVIGSSPKVKIEPSSPSTSRTECGDGRAATQDAAVESPMPLRKRRRLSIVPKVEHSISVISGPAAHDTTSPIEAGITCVDAVTSRLRAKSHSGSSDADTESRGLGSVRAPWSEDDSSSDSSDSEDSDSDTGFTFDPRSMQRSRPSKSAAALVTLESSATHSFQSSGLDLRSFLPNVKAMSRTKAGSSEAVAGRRQGGGAARDLLTDTGLPVDEMPKDVYHRQVLNCQKPPVYDNHEIAANLELYRSQKLDDRFISEPVRRGMREGRISIAYALKLTHLQMAAGIYGLLAATTSCDTKALKDHVVHIRNVPDFEPESPWIKLMLKISIACGAYVVVLLIEDVLHTYFSDIASSRRAMQGYSGQVGSIDLTFESPVHASWYTRWTPPDGGRAHLIMNPYIFLRFIDRRHDWLARPRATLLAEEKLALARRNIFNPLALTESEWMRYFASTTYPTEKRQIYETTRITLYIEAYEAILAQSPLDIWPNVRVCIRTGAEVAAGLSKGLPERAIELARKCGCRSEGEDQLKTARGGVLVPSFFLPLPDVEVSEKTRVESLLAFLQRLDTACVRMRSQTT